MKTVLLFLAVTAAPAVAENVMTADLHPYSVALQRKKD